MTGIIVLLAAVGGWWYFGLGSEQPTSDNSLAAAAGDPTHSSPDADEVALVSDEQVIIAGGPATPSPTLQEPVESPFRPQSAPDPTVDDSPATTDDPAAARAGDDTRTGNAAIEKARQLYESGKVIEARHQLNALLNRRLTGAENAEVRALLTRLANETLFGRRSLPDDPLVDSYTIQSGDVLINIGRRFGVPHEVLTAINNITDAKRIRVNQRLKVLRGPFHARIYKSRFRLDIYLGNLYVRSYPVGLGAAGSTPEGVWKVKERLSNPTYYPPASAADKRIIPADDPTNPLGEHWIGLEGVEGQALGHEGYGIHGTIEPQTIGKAVSLGCIRMHNKDVAFFYSLMLPGRSTVTILP